MDIDDPDFLAISSEGEVEVLRLRASILEWVGHIDGVLNNILGLYFTTDKDMLPLLTTDLMPGVSLDRRVATLRKLIEIEVREDDYPYLTLLPEVTRLRNILAHMSFDIFESSDDVLVFEGWRKGQHQRHSVKMEHLRDVDATAWHASVDLRLLHERLWEGYLGDNDPVSDMKDETGG